MLDLIEKKSNVKKFYNCELSFEIYKNQINNRINLIGGQGQNLPFKQNSFDYVICANLFHHIVGATRKESKSFCTRTMNEMIRVLKNDGNIVIIEQYVMNRLSGSIIFYITLILSFLKISVKQIGLSKGMIVSFLTSSEIEELLTKNTAEVSIIQKKKREDILDNLLFNINCCIHLSC